MPASAFCVYLLLAWVSKQLKTKFVCLYFNCHTNPKLHILKVIFGFGVPSIIFPIVHSKQIPDNLHNKFWQWKYFITHIYIYILKYIYNTSWSKQYLRQLIHIKCFTNYCHIQLCETCYYSHSTSEFTKS